jgi:hypothetical protein
LLRCRQGQPSVRAARISWISSPGVSKIQPQGKMTRVMSAACS